MPNLDRFVYYACGVLNFKDTTSTADSLLDLCVQFSESYNKISKYYFIAHTDTDILHIHFIFYLSSQVRLMTIFNKMRDFYVSKTKSMIDEYGINIAKCESINAHLRYFLHKDESSKNECKKQYELEDIVSNDDIDIIEGLINSRKGEIDAYYLRDCVLDCKDDFELMNKLGLKVYHKYRYEIDILKDMRINLVRMREEERNNRLTEDLPF